MTEKRRFSTLMSYQPFDRLPVYYFGTWAETMDRWVTEGLSSPHAVVTETHLDGNWESGMWRVYGLSDPRPMSDESDVVLEETDDYQIVRTAPPAVLKQVKPISSIPQHIKEALLPDRKSWRQFKRFLYPDDPRKRSRPGRRGQALSALRLTALSLPVCNGGGNSILGEHRAVDFHGG